GLGRRLLARDGQHLFGRVDRGHNRRAPSEKERRTPGSSADVEDLPALDPADEVRDHARLRAGDELTDRAAEPLFVERSGGGWIAVDRVAVMVRLRRLAHAR